MKSFTLLTLSALFAGALSVGHGANTLKVGDPAPKLQVGKWIQGDPIKEFQKDKAYIVEFWATWCGPCRATIPHLNEIHKKFKDKGLIVIGQDVWERDESAVPDFVKTMGQKMTYRVALDDKDGSERGKMAETWMQAAGQNGIPAAFLVNKEGVVAWIGHPAQLQDKIVESVLDGSFDVKKAAQDFESRSKNEAQMEELSGKLNSAARAKKWDDAEAALDEMEKLLPEDERAHFSMNRFRIRISKGDYPAAYQFARELSEKNKNDAILQNEIAWTIATMEGLKERDLDLALTIAKRANDAASGKDPNILDTLARVYFMKGDKERAMDLQTQAIDLAEGRQKDQFRQTLKSYREGKVPEE